MEARKAEIEELKKKLNSNVTTQGPRFIEIKKIAIKLEEYDYLRADPSVEIADLDEPGPPIPHVGEGEYLNYYNIIPYKKQNIRKKK